MNTYYKISIIFLLIFSGCQLTNEKNSAIKDADHQISIISSHIEDISDSNHVYDNSKINLDILYSSKQALKNDVAQIIADQQSQKITSAQYQSGLEECLSALHFIWMEEFDAAYKNNNQDALNKTRLEYNEFINISEIQTYYEQLEQVDKIENLQNTINEVIAFTEQLKKINDNNTKLVSLKENMDKLSADNQLAAYNQLVGEYNTLLEENNSLINDYNQKIQLYNSEKIYQDFLALIEINKIFPHQNSLNLTQ